MTNPRTFWKFLDCSRSASNHAILLSKCIFIFGTVKVSPKAPFQKKKVSVSVANSRPTRNLPLKALAPQTLEKVSENETN